MITVTNDGITVTATDGKRSRSSTCATPSAARSLETRIKNDLVFADKWLGPPFQIAPPATNIAAPSGTQKQDRIALTTKAPAEVSVTRHDTIVKIRDWTGKVLRSFDCRSIQGAVSLETKLTNDHAFAVQWARDVDPKSSDFRPHGLERPWR